MAGYFQQLTDESGAGATLRGFEGRVAGIGPQIGFIYCSLKTTGLSQPEGL